MRFLVDTNTFRHPAVSYWEHQEDELTMFGPWLIAYRRYQWRPKPQAEVITNEIRFVPALGMSGQNHDIAFFTYWLLQLEGWTIKPPVDWARRSIPDLFNLQILKTQNEYQGLLVGGGKKLSKRIQHFVNGIQDQRFKEIVNVLGTKHSQDALHILVCERHQLDGIITLDGTFKRHFDKSKKHLKTDVQALFPSQVCEMVGIAPIGDEWFEEGKNDVFTNNLVQLFQRRASLGDRALYKFYNALMHLRKRYGVKVRFVIPGY